MRNDHGSNATILHFACLHSFLWLPLSAAVRDVHSLVIRSVGHVHGGVYKSVISNKVGKATCYSHLYVTGGPPYESSGQRASVGGVDFHLCPLQTFSPTLLMGRRS